MRRQIKLAFAVIIALCITVVIVLFKPSNTPIELPTARDLKNCELLIENAVCEEGEYQIVTDAAFQKAISKLCQGVEPFRTYIAEFDMILGVGDFIPHIYFTSENVQYCFIFSGVYEQMQYDFIHRDKPLILVTKTVKDKVGELQEAWKWYCVMEAADYSSLYNMVYRYTDGTITEEFPAFSK